MTDPKKEAEGRGAVSLDQKSPRAASCGDTVLLARRQRKECGVTEKGEREKPSYKQFRLWNLNFLLLLHNHDEPSRRGRNRRDWGDSRSRLLLLLLLGPRSPPRAAVAPRLRPVPRAPPHRRPRLPTAGRADDPDHVLTFAAGRARARQRAPRFCRLCHVA